MKKGRNAIVPNPPAPTAPVADTSAATALPAPARLPTAPVAADLHKPEYLTPGTAVVAEEIEEKSLGNVREERAGGLVSV